MPFGAASVLTNKGRAMLTDRLRTTPATYTSGPRYTAVGTGATSAARTANAADTALSNEVETRAAGAESTITTSVTGDTYQTVGTTTFTAPRNVDEAGCFDASTGGNMAVSITAAAAAYNTGDSLQQTFKIQIG